MASEMGRNAQYRIELSKSGSQICKTDESWRKKSYAAGSVLSRRRVTLELQISLALVGNSLRTAEIL